MSSDQVTSCDSMSLRQRCGNRYSEHLKNINADMGYNFTNWLTFTTNFDTEFILSALPNHSKLLLKEKFEKQQNTLKEDLKALNKSHDVEEEDFTSRASARKSETSLNESTRSNESTEIKMNFANKFKKISPTLFMNKMNKNQSLFVKNKKKILFTNNLYNNDPKTQNTSQFNFDDYFDKYHKISTNQNFRFSQLISSDQKNNDENDSDDNFILQKVAPNRLPTNTNNSQTASSKTRLNYKLNSYKDNRFYPYNNVSFESLTKPNEKTSSNGLGVSSFLDGGNKVDCFKNLFNLQHAPDDNSKYLIWDNKVKSILYSKNFVNKIIDSKI